MNINVNPAPAGRCIAIILALFCLLPSRPASGEIIPSNNRIAWSAGVPGGIPARTTIYTTLSPGVTAAQINSALANCPANQVVFLSAGTYNLNAPIVCSKSSVTLRGAGPKNTILNFSGTSPYALIDFAGNSPWNPPSSRLKNWVGGLTKGSTSITLDSVGDLAVGNLLILDQVADNILVAPPAAGTGGDIGRGNDRVQFQVVTVTGISGNTINISPGIYMTNWSASLSPQAWWWGPSVSLSGVEDLKVDGSGSGATYNVRFTTAYACWARNIESTFSGTASADAFRTKNCEIRDSYFHDARNYGVECYGNDYMMSSDLLCENNIFFKISCAILPRSGSSGCVMAYNYCTNMYNGLPSWQSEGISANHQAHPSMNLYEGNFVSTSMYFDFIHGSSSHNTVFRNRLYGYEQGKDNNTFAVVCEITNRWMNFVGNVLGTAGYHNTYQNVVTSSAWSYKAIYRLGYAVAGDPSTSGGDPVTVTSTLRHGNYDVANNGIVWDPSISDHVIPSSLYLANKPAWFGDRPWPLVDPANPAAATDLNLPAGYRFAYGTNPPSGGVVNLAPVAVATASVKNGVAPLATSFSSSGSYDPEGVSLTYNWSFGDGTSSTAANPAKTYNSPGSYTAQLTVSDGVNSSSATVVITATAAGVNQAPVAVASASTSAGSAPLTVTFSSAGSSDPEGTTLTYNWNFGDGTSSISANPTKIYQTAGVYPARLTVSDGTNTASSTVITITAGSASAGLVAAYGFEEGSGTATGDASGNNNVGTLAGATWAPSGKFGTALNFGGSGLVSINDSASLHLSSAITIEAWVKPATLSGWMNLIYKPVSSSTISFVMQGSTSPSQLASMGGSFSASNLTAPSPLPLNTWSHIAGTFDGATMKFYVNGILVATRAQAGTLAASTLPLTIGGNTDFGEYWSGLIDEVRIYSRALSQNEVHNDMNTPVSGTVVRPGSPTLQSVGP